MPPSDQLEEIGALATLIDENRFNYSLDALCDWRGLPGKDTALLEEAIKAAGFKISKKNPLQSYIWQMPARYVGRYAEADPIATLGLFESLDPILDREGTRAAYRLDVDLLPMVHEMRRRGIRVDQSAAEQARDYCLQKRDPRAHRAVGAAWQPREHGTKSRRQNGKREPLTPITSIIRARRRATPHSRPANSGGWPHIPIGCRS